MSNRRQRALQEAVKRLYSVFAAYPLRQDTEPCECCHSPEEELVLHSKPLRELTEGNLYDYSGDAILTWGNADDFRHFLPRLFELITEHSGYLELEPLFAKLRHGDWRTWPVEEQEAVEHYFAALWKWCLVREDEEWLAEDLLCGIAQAVDDISPYLAEWRNERQQSAYEKLAYLVTWHREELISDGRLGHAWWADRKAQLDRVIEWLLEPETVDMLQSGLRLARTGPASEKLASALNVMTQAMEKRG